MIKIFASLFLLMLLPLAAGCGKGKSGVAVKVTTATPGIAPLSKTQFAATGDGATDTFNDRLMNPHSFTLAFKSFKLFTTPTGTGTGATPGTTGPTYNVFDVGTATGTVAATPIVVLLKSDETRDVSENNSEPSQGTYDRIEYELRYIEMTVPVCRTNDSCEDHRIRVYFTNEPDPTLNNFTSAAAEILFSRSVNGTDFSWISPTDGLPLSLVNFPITGGRPTDPYKVPATQFPAGAVGPTFKLPISPPLVIDKKPEKVFVFTLNFDLSNLFFFDNTDELNGSDPGPDFHFNALADNPTITRDGRILRDCTGLDPDICRADFWPGIPIPTLSLSQEERK